MRVLLVSTYDLGHQPFGLASPAAWLREAGHEVFCADLAVQTLPPQLLQEVDGIAFYLPMHTATRLVGKLLPKLLQQQLQQSLRLCAYGLYASLNVTYLRSLGIDTILGGEYEADLLAWANNAHSAPETAEPLLPRLAFRVPDRTTLPVLQQYAKLRVGDTQRIVGATDSTRGCRHLCRHCPVVPVYHGQFRVVPVDTVLADIRQQVAAGAEHISFGDPDFLNGPTHARRIIEQLHTEFPALTYDATIKVEHLLRHRNLLPLLKQTGCLFIVSAIESLQDDVLALLEKGHTRADFLKAVHLCREVGLTLSPTFIPFTPWTTRDTYRDLLFTLRELDLVEQVSPVQFALRLLIPANSRLLELPEIQAVISDYDEAALLWRWRHPDPTMDEFAAAFMRTTSQAQRQGLTRSESFAQLWTLSGGAPNFVPAPRTSRTTVPYLEEPWYC